MTVSTADKINHAEFFGFFGHGDMADDANRSAFAADAFARIACCNSIAL